MSFIEPKIVPMSINDKTVRVEDLSIVRRDEMHISRVITRIGAKQSNVLPTIENIASHRVSDGQQELFEDKPRYHIGGDLVNVSRSRQAVEALKPTAARSRVLPARFLKRVKWSHNFASHRIRKGVYRG